MTCLGLCFLTRVLPPSYEQLEAGHRAFLIFVSPYLYVLDQDAQSLFSFGLEERYLRIFGLRCNSHTVKFTHLKRTMQWVLFFVFCFFSIVTELYNLTQSTLEHFHRLIKKPLFLSSLPSLRQPIIYFLSLQI